MDVNTTAVQPQKGKVAAADAESKVGSAVCDGEAKETLHSLQALLETPLNMHFAGRGNL